MRALSEMTTIEIAILFHELFPDEIPRFLGYVEQAIIVELDKPLNTKSNWKPLKMSVREAVELLRDMQNKIVNQRAELKKRSELFAWALFSGNNAPFLVKCIHDYISICPDSRCRLIIEGLFEL